MIHIDLEAGTVTVDGETGAKTYPLDSPEAFSVVSKAWLRAGWDTKYVYGFSWMGRPIIQLPEDMIRIQEVIYNVRPTLIVETGIAHGGSLVYYASLLKAMAANGRAPGRVVGIDIEIRPHNRRAIEAHELFPFMTLVEGSSVDPKVVDLVRDLVAADDRVLVILDSNHTKAHVLAELEAYSGLVSPGSYIVATDGIMESLAGAPRSRPEWDRDNPKAAAEAFVAAHPDFVIEEPEFHFNEGAVRERVTYWPSAYVKRLR